MGPLEDPRTQYRMDLVDVIAPGARVNVSALFNTRDPASRQLPADDDRYQRAFIFTREAGKPGRVLWVFNPEVGNPSGGPTFVYDLLASTEALQRGEKRLVQYRVETPPHAFELEAGQAAEGFFLREVEATLGSDTYRDTRNTEPLGHIDYILGSQALTDRVHAILTEVAIESATRLQPDNPQVRALRETHLGTGSSVLRDDEALPNITDDGWWAYAQQTFQTFANEVDRVQNIDPEFARLTATLM